MVLIPVFVIIFGLFLTIPYIIVKYLPQKYRVSIRIWIICFFAQMTIIAFFPPEVMEGLGFQSAWGFVYMIAFIKQTPDIIKGILNGYPHAKSFLLLFIFPSVAGLISLSVFVIRSRYKKQLL